MNKQLIIAVLVSLITACGGGGGAAPEVVEQPVVNDQMRTEDLVAPEDFQFTTSREVSFDIEAPTLDGKRAFVSVYTEYFLVDGVLPFPKYNSRVFMMPLTNNKIDIGTQIPNDVTKVLVQIASDNVADGVAVNVLEIHSNNEVAWNY